MMKVRTLMAGLLAAVAGVAAAQGGAPQPAPVTIDNFIRAESDRYLAAVVRRGAFGKLVHDRVLRPLDQITVVNINRDTLYSVGVFDLDAGPVTITLPDAGTRYRSLVTINQDHEVTPAIYAAGSYTVTRAQIGTRYVLVGIRTLIDPSNAADLKQAHAMQDAIHVAQREPGRFEVPAWDAAGLKAIRDPLLALRGSLPDTRATFGRKTEVNPLRHLIGTANAWGGIREQDAFYLNVVPAHNDGTTIYRLTVRDVPVDGFWSVSVYDDQGFFRPNPQAAYALNNLTARKAADGSVVLQFGGCDGQRPNCLPAPPGWNYMVRLYRPRAEVLDGRWSLPQAEPVTP